MRIIMVGGDRYLWGRGWAIEYVLYRWKQCKMIVSSICDAFHQKRYASSHNDDL